MIWARSGGPFLIQLTALAADHGDEMIRLHKLGRTPQPFHLNPDLILTVEANPDTVVLLTTGSRLVVVETPEKVAEAVLAG
jgi:flagellar protein FlbD